MKSLGPKLRVAAVDPQKYGPVISYLLTPVAMTGYALALWRLGADLRWAGEFFIADGVFSKWQVWLALAIGTQTAAHRLKNPAGRSGDAAGV